jgi:uncharacterized protein Veg
VSKSRRYEKISLNRKKNTPSQGGYNEPYPSMYILYKKKKKNANTIDTILNNFLMKIFK